MSDTKSAAFKDVIKDRVVVPPLPVDDVPGRARPLIAAHHPFRRDEVIPAIGRGPRLARSRPARTRSSSTTSGSG